VRIPDPFVGDNERLVQWVAEAAFASERDWEYRCTFEIAPRLLDEERVFLGENDVSVVDLDRCIGCGLCVVSCPTEAARLAPKPADEWRTPPANSREQMMAMAKKRGIRFRSDSRRPSGLASGTGRSDRIP